MMRLARIESLLKENAEGIGDYIRDWPQPLDINTWLTCDLANVPIEMLMNAHGGLFYARPVFCVAVEIRLTPC